MFAFYFPFVASLCFGDLLLSSYNFISYSIQALFEKQFKIHSSLFFCASLYIIQQVTTNTTGPVWIKLVIGYLHKILIVMSWALCSVDEDISPMMFLYLQG
jgi:hypothetical protein